MKKITVISLLVLILLELSTSANAALLDRGGGMIYDDVLEITWLQDANYAFTSGYDGDGKMTWSDAVAWADQLEYGGCDDWRLPHIDPVDPLNGFDFTWAYDGSTDAGYNITSPNSELMYMYYVNLNNPGAYYPNSEVNSEWGKFNTGDFLNLVRSDDLFFWSGVPKDENYILAANYYAGSQVSIEPSVLAYSWAVCDGDIAAIPIPSTVLLLFSGITGLFFIRRRSKTGTQKSINRHKFLNLERFQ